METLTQLSNGELATRLYEITKRYGECCLWIADAELKLYRVITEADRGIMNAEEQAEITKQIEFKKGAELEKYIALSNLKKIELEMDRRVLGEPNV